MQDVVGFFTELFIRRVLLDLVGSLSCGVMGNSRVVLGSGFSAVKCFSVNGCECSRAVLLEAPRLKKCIRIKSWCILYCS